jgi:hypothetical protein
MFSPSSLPVKRFQCHSKSTLRLLSFWPFAFARINILQSRYAEGDAQGRGRARAEGSSYVVFAQRDDRPAALPADERSHEAAAVREVVVREVAARTSRRRSA